MGQAQLPPQQPTKSTLTQILGRVGVVGAIALTATTLGGFWYGRYFINEQLSPLLQTELAKALKRPLQLGEVERFSFSSVRFGKSLVPPTAQESNFLAVDALEVKVDLWSYLTRRQLGLDAIAEKPQVFLKQDVSGMLQLPKITKPAPDQEAGFVDLRTLRFDNAQVTIQTIARGELVSLSQVQIDSKWQITDPNNQSLQMNGQGRVTLPNLAAITAPPSPEQLALAIANAEALPDGNKGKVSFNVDWDLTNGQGTVDLRSNNLEVAAVQGFAINAPVTVEQGEINAEAKISIIAGRELPTVALTAELFSGAVKSPQLPKPITNIAGQFSFDGNTATLKDFVAEYDFLKAAIAGTFSEKTGFNISFANTTIDLAKGAESFNLKLPVAIAGQVDLGGKLTGLLSKPSLTLNLNAPKPISIDRVNIDRLLATVELQDANTIRIKKVQAASTGATLTGEGQIRLPQKDQPAEILFNSNLVGVVEDFAALYNAKLPITIGQVITNVQVAGSLEDPQILAQVNAPNAQYPAQGEVSIVNGLATIRNTKVKFPIGEVGLAGTYNLADGAWKSQLNSNGIPLSAFLLNQKGFIQGLINLRSDRGSFKLSDITADASLSLPQGLTELPDAIAANLTWDGRNLLVPSLEVGNYLTANGKIDLAYDQNQLPSGIAALDLDLVSQNVSIDRLASLSSVIPAKATGLLNFRGNLAGAIDQLKIAGALQLDNVDLASLGSGLAKQGITAPSRGKLNFDGAIAGAITSPQLTGKLQVANVRINQIELDNATFNGSMNAVNSVIQATGKLALAGLRLDRNAFAQGSSIAKNPFDIDRLTGTLDFNSNQGLNLDLRRNDSITSDRLIAQLDAAFRPVNLDLKIGKTTAIAKRLENNPNRLNVNVDHLPLALITSIAGQNDVGGQLSSRLVVDIDQSPKAIGQITVDSPRFGRVVGNKAIAQISYANGILDIKDGNLNIRKADFSNDYKFRFTYDPNAENQLVGNVKITKGKVQDILATLQWSNVVDITQGINLAANRASDLKPLEAIALLGDPLYKQLQYLAQLSKRQEQQEIVDSARNFDLPPLTSFYGDIEGDLGFRFSQRRGFRFNFDLVGKNFSYNKYDIADVQLKGGYGNGVFRLANANFQSGESYGRITDARIRVTTDPNPLLRFREQSGKVELKDFPIESIRFLPFFRKNAFENIKGKVNGSLAIAGTNVLDLKIDGDLNLTNGSYNDQPIERVAVKFNYAALNVNFDVNMNLAEGAVLAAGNVGVFGNFKVKLDVKDGGIALINAINPTLNWISGKGAININADGTFRDPKIAGKVTLDNAQIEVLGLPGKFTEVTGAIDFTRDRLFSEITSKFSDGNLQINGFLPISNTQLFTQESPEYQKALAINADKLKLNIRDISSDNFNSRVIVRGSLFEPILTGEVLLGEGRFVIGNDAAAESQGANASPTADIAFDRLAVKLQNMQVTRFPIFNFLGEGTLIFNGTLQRPEPEGRIKISRGQFNAISARFRLDRAYENFVEFRPSQGFNPNLNVRVSGAVAEVTRVPINSNRPNDLFSPNEVPVSNLGAQKTLRVQASVTGTALAPDIRLSSSPPRSQAEIVTLIGGGVLQQQGGSDPASALANLAGGTVLNFLQDAIGDALNLAEFNLSPVTTNSEGTSTGTLGLSAEAAIDVSNSFSVALQRIINDSTQPTNFAVRYRVDPNVLLRGSYSSNGQTGISVEYENRF